MTAAQQDEEPSLNVIRFALALAALTLVALVPWLALTRTDVEALVPIGIVAFAVLLLVGLGLAAPDTEEAGADEPGGRKERRRN